MGLPVSGVERGDGRGRFRRGETASARAPTNERGRMQVGPWWWVGLAGVRVRASWAVRRARLAAGASVGIFPLLFSSKFLTLFYFYFSIRSTLYVYHLSGIHLGQP